MRKLFTLILVGMVLLAGCTKKTIVNDQAATEKIPVAAEQEAPPATAAGEIMTEPPLLTLQKKQPVATRATDRIYFDFNSHQLTSDSKKALGDNALWLQAEPEVRLVIEGHADERGSDKYNLDLGRKRADVARHYLMGLGIAPERITIVSYGREKATRAGNEIVWALDRKAQLVTIN